MSEGLISNLFLVGFCAPESKVLCVKESLASKLVSCTAWELKHYRKV
jgi:hypothetical protein